MSTMTVTERVAASEMWVKNHPIGAMETYTLENEVRDGKRVTFRKLAHYDQWVTVINFPADNCKLRLLEPEQDPEGYEPEEVGYTWSNYWGRVMTIVQGGSINDYNAGHTQPTAEGTLQTVLSAVNSYINAEATGGFPSWMSEYHAGSPAVPMDNITDAWDTYQTHAAWTHELRKLLGDEFMEWVNNTEFDQ